MWSHPAKMFLLLTTLLTLSDAVIIPEIATVFKGDSQVFSCHKNGYSTSDFQIQFRPARSIDLILIYSQSHNGLNPSQAAHYRVEKNDVRRTYDLYVLKALSAHAGKYICHWGERTDEAELIVLDFDSQTSSSTSIPACVSTTLNNSTETNPHNLVSVVRFECIVPFHGNILPSVEFWIITSSSTFGPFEGSSERNYNTSRTVLMQKIFSVSSDIHYACRLRNTSRSSIIQSDCSFKNNTGSTCLITYKMAYRDAASQSATPQLGINSHSACQLLCSENPSCVSYQINNNIKQKDYCWLQKSLEKFQDNLLYRQNISEYLKYNSCRSDINFNSYRPFNVDCFTTIEEMLIFIGFYIAAFVLLGVVITACCCLVGWISSKKDKHSKTKKEMNLLIPKDRKRQKNKIQTSTDITTIHLEDVVHLDIQTSLQINEITWMRDKVYLSGSSSNTIYVFSGINPFIPEPSISLPLEVGIIDLSSCDIDGKELFLIFRNSNDSMVDGRSHTSFVWLYDVKHNNFSVFTIKGRILKIAFTVCGNLLLLKKVHKNSNEAEPRHRISILECIYDVELPEQIYNPEQIAQLSNDNFLVTHQIDAENSNEEIKTIIVSEINSKNGEIVRSWDSFEGMTGTTFSIPESYAIKIDEQDNMFITDNITCEIIVIHLDSRKFRKILDSETSNDSSGRITGKFQNIHYIPEKHLALEIRSTVTSSTEIAPEEIESPDLPSSECLLVEIH